MTFLKIGNKTLYGWPATLTFIAMLYGAGFLIVGIFASLLYG